ncbi:hypothetical protein T09_9397 [Trichinella sp. T9]|nr:hypothetical protein T09_9397 [Trichinella sp. T9]
MLCTISGGEKGQTSTLRAHWWPISTGGNLHWPTILATGWLISWPTRLCHMTWQGHLRTCSPKYPRRRAVQHHDAVSVHLHSVNGQKRLGTTCISLLLRNPRLNNTSSGCRLAAPHGNF